MKRIVAAPLHPVLFAMAFVLQPAVLNGVEAPGFVRALLASAVLAALVTTMVSLVFRSWVTGGLLATGALLFVCSRDPFLASIQLLRDAFGLSMAIVIFGGLLIILGWGVVAAVMGVVRHGVGKGLARPVTRALNIFGLVLIVGAIGLGMPTIAGPLFEPEPAIRDQKAAARDMPDIYVLLLDGYARDDQLERQVGYDNAPFLSALEALGFQVDRDSHSNYTYSALTFTSLFEVDYVRAERNAAVHDGELRERLHQALRSGPAVRALHEAGYEIVATAGGWEHDTFRGRVDRFLDRPELTDFERQVLQRTWIMDMPIVPQNLFFAELHRRVNGVLNDAVEVASEDRTHPAFVFVHVAAPHLPMAFDVDGGPTRLSSRVYGAGRASAFGLSEEEYRAAYGASLTHLNARVLDTITAIREEAANRGAGEPAIVLLSDHGLITDIPIHGPPMLANLFAASLPGASPSWDAPTPVNLVPALLAAYGDSNLLHPIPDRYFTTVIENQTLHITEIPRP
jgi:hypothetical protein